MDLFYIVFGVRFINSNSLPFIMGDCAGTQDFDLASLVLYDRPPFFTERAIAANVESGVMFNIHDFTTLVDKMDLRARQRLVGVLYNGVQSQTQRRNTEQVFLYITALEHLTTSH